MVFEQIEQLKQQFTDKYVVINTDRPELARFRDVVGQVKTVNMSGRALVQFDDYYSNIAWYDIDPDFLKVVDKPAPKPVEAKAKPTPAKPKPAAKPKAAPAEAGEKKLSPLEMARMQGAAKKGAGEKPPAAGAKLAPKGKMSVQEMLTAARGEKQEAAPAQAKQEPTPEKPATPKKPATKPSVDRSKMSVGEMLAAARAEKSGAAATANSAPAEAPVAQEPAVEEQPGDQEEAVESTPIAAKAEGPSSSAASQTAAATKVDRTKMTVADMIAWCREHDTK